MGEGGVVGLSEDVVFELHLKRWVEAGQVGEEKLEEAFPGIRKIRNKGMEP